MNNIVKLVATALPNQKKYILLCGAGISIDAGVPTGWQIMMNILEHIKTVEEPESKLDIETWYKQSEYTDKTYADILGAVFEKPQNQQEYFEEHLSNKEIGETHNLIALLAKRGIIRAVITTNFDEYIEKSFTSNEIKYQVISNDDDLIESEPIIHCTKIRIYKPHGTMGKGKIRNTRKDLEKLSPEFTNELCKIIGEHGLLVMGYAGNEDDKAILDILEKSCYHGKSIYPIFLDKSSKTNRANAGNI